jgi:hypothetical protein
MLFTVALMWQKTGRKVNTYLDRQAVSLKIDTIVSTQWHPNIKGHLGTKAVLKSLGNIGHPSL